MARHYGETAKKLAGFAARFVPPAAQIRIRYRSVFGRFPDLEDPKTFNERIQVMKLRDRNPLYPVISDKYAVREYVGEKIGEGYLNELYGVYRDAGDIDFEALPDSFVVKAAHSCARNLLCRDKGSLDLRRAVATLNRWLREDYSRQSFGKLEWQYRDIPRRLVCEKFIEDSEGHLYDYKIFCFGGVPHAVQVDLDRGADHRRNFYDTGWNRLDINLKYPQADRDVPAPASLPGMLDAARRLSEGLPFVRADFYDVDGKAVFGELTLSPGSGYVPFVPASVDEEWGRLIGEAIP